MLFFVYTVVGTSIIGLAMSADLSVKMVLFVLIALSVIIWAIFFEKTYRIRSLLLKTDSFEKKFWSGIMLEDFYESNKSKLKHPVGQIFSAAMQEWVSSDTNKSVSAIELVKVGLRERIGISIEATKEKIEIAISRYMGFMAVIAGVSPFIGLFGTVIGIMNSFKAIADAGNANLVAVAPGVAEALVTTAVGIFVALCASGINLYLGYRISVLMDKLNTFSSELFNILSRELDSFSIRNYNNYHGIKDDVDDFKD